MDKAIRVRSGVNAFGGKGLSWNSRDLTAILSTRSLKIHETGPFLANMISIYSEKFGAIKYPVTKELNKYNKADDVSNLYKSDCKYYGRLVNYLRRTNTVTEAVNLLKKEGFIFDSKEELTFTNSRLKEENLSQGV